MSWVENFLKVNKREGEEGGTSIGDLKVINSLEYKKSNIFLQKSYRKLGIRLNYRELDLGLFFKKLYF